MITIRLAAKRCRCGYPTVIADILQVDGYEVYNAVGSQPGIRLVGCMAHARRKFDEALKAQGKTHQRDQTKVSNAQQGLHYIQALYRIERELKTAMPEERYRVRQEKAKPCSRRYAPGWIRSCRPCHPKA